MVHLMMPSIFFVGILYHLHDMVPNHTSMNLPSIQRRMPRVVRVKLSSLANQSGTSRRAIDSHQHHLGVSKKRFFFTQKWVTFNRVFHYKPSILGGFSPYFWKHPSINMTLVETCFFIGGLF